VSQAGLDDVHPLLTAEHIVAFLDRRGVASALIGAVALAARGYARSTEDVDLAVGIEPAQLAAIARDLEAEGYSVDLSLPDPADPLGGVVRVSGVGLGRVEIVNFSNPPGGGFPELAELVVRDATPYREGSALLVATVPHLVLSKLYAGGPKSRLDVLELLSRNPDVNLGELRALCRRFRLDRRLEAWFRELGAADD
jgi:hypothetical protein